MAGRRCSVGCGWGVLKVFSHHPLPTCRPDRRQDHQPREQGRSRAPVQFFRCVSNAASLSCYSLSAGKITSLVSKGDRVLAERIEDALQRGLPLDSLSANRAVLPAHMR